MFLLLNDLTRQSARFDDKSYLKVYFQVSFSSKDCIERSSKSFKSGFLCFFLSKITRGKDFQLSIINYQLSIIKPDSSCRRLEVHELTSRTAFFVVAFDEGQRVLAQLVVLCTRTQNIYQ